MRKKNNQIKSYLLVVSVVSSCLVESGAQCDAVGMAMDCAHPKPAVNLGSSSPAISHTNWGLSPRGGCPHVTTETGSGGTEADSAHRAAAGPVSAGLAGRGSGRGGRCGGRLLGAQGLLCGLPGGAQISKPALLKS